MTQYKHLAAKKCEKEQYIFPYFQVPVPKCLITTLAADQRQHRCMVQSAYWYPRVLQSNLHPSVFTLYIAEISHVKSHQNLCLIIFCLSSCFRLFSKFSCCSSIFVSRSFRCELLRLHETKNCVAKSSKKTDNSHDNCPRLECSQSQHLALQTFVTPFQISFVKIYRTIISCSKCFEKDSVLFLIQLQ